MKKALSLILALVFSCGAIMLSGCTTEPENSSQPAESSKVPVAVAKKLRVGSYNIANGREINHDLKLLADDILEKELDIVGLQEVDRFCSRSKFLDTTKLLSEYTGYEYVAYFKCIDLAGDAATYGQEGEYGTAILSKYPIVSTESIELNPGDKVERRVLGCTKIDVNGTEINFFNTHLTIADPRVRADEFLKVAEAVKDKKNCLLTGDFNVSSFDEFAVVDLTITNNPERDIITFPSNQRRIDNILYSEEFTLVEDSVGVLDNNHSDHYLFFAEYEYIVME
ncbi:MAG: endonuclease/exonuclease/phosphatase family protein [Clostridia bacterium]|nr:endonuclease/exonuclease/phosphatase family protein [Clostridia bacterium]